MRNVDTTSDSGCWLWTGPQISDSGYGKTRPYPGDRERATHIVMWEHANARPVPEGHQIDHRCHTDAVARGECGGGECLHRLCCNPAHLEPVTPSENTKRQDHAERRVTHCPKGHPYDSENTRLRRGRRECVQCDVERKRRARAE
ncbi:MAG: hypothetical protein ACOYB3_01935 [Azonexus sp.]